MQTFRVSILDDLGHPELEGTETFDVVLRMPVNGILGEPAKATVFINDSVSDCKSLLFFLPEIIFILTSSIQKQLSSYIDFNKHEILYTSSYF